MRMNDNISYSSVAEIHNALVRKEYSPRDLFDYIQSNYSDWKDEKTQDRIQGSENDFHNLSVEFSKNDCEPFAAATAIIGVEFYPMSTNLLADAIKYSQEIGDFENCKRGFEALKKIDRKYWTWRTFVFAIDYLKGSLSSVSKIEEFEKNIDEAKTLIEEFKEYIPHDERSYVAEAELYQNQNDYNKAIEVLRVGVNAVVVAPQCCMKLAYLQLERGEYEEAKIYAKKGILATIQDQPTISLGYLYYILALTMDASRIIRREAGASIDEGEIQNILTAYHTADKLLINEGRLNVSYRNTIKARLIVMKQEEGLPENEEDDKSVSLDDMQKFLDMIKK